MEIPRQDPDLLLKAILNDTSKQKRGKLKIFFGYAAGVGKTYAMLQAAHQAKERGVDVVSGYIEPHARPQTMALLNGMEQLPVTQVYYGEITLREFDIDGALKRKPQLILVDELAHTNAEGSRHAKRYQDVQELLNAGIDVYTTVNVQHIESLNDTVASITGVLVRERIPDSVFDQADQVELVDIEPAELLERMASGNIYREDQAQRAAVNFFTVENLTALREIALRRCADRVNLLTENARIQSRGDYHTDEHILVCLSSSPSNAKIIRTAARMARAFRGSFTALFVETPATAEMSDDDKKWLRENMRLAQQLGAHIETSYGEDVPYQIAEFARLSGVSKIVIGRSTAARKSIFSKPTLTERLISDAPNLDIHVIPDASVGNTYQKRANKTLRITAMPVRDVAKSILVLLSATLIGYAFYTLGFSEANIVSVYIFGVLVISVITTNRFCGVAASIVSVLVFNFFFTVPRFTFHFNDPNYLVTFPIMFMVALLTGSLATRLKDNAKQSARAAYRTKILFETNQLLQKEFDEQSVVKATAGQLLKLLKKDIVIYLSDGKKLADPIIFRTPDSDQCELVSENEEAVAAWVLRNNKHAGATTDTLSSANCLYLAIRVNQQVYGVVGIAMNGIPLDSFENSVLLSILGECALALENIKNAREKEEAAILAKNEQLRANLLRAISHDLRTPLTSISGNANNLLANYQKMDDATRKRTFTDIYDDSMWLINLVENLLAVTRIEGGQVHLTQSVELMDEVITEALRHINRKSKEHTIRVSSSEELILARIDAKLIVQVIINLVDNAVKYTPAGSVIEIHTEKDAHWVIVSVSDNGPGIPDEQKSHVFDMFYSGANKIADSRRSLGLGLSLCKTIVTAHGGTISVADNHPRGTVFLFTIPAGEVELHE
ncbi:MAG: sensor histidine kinase KdpD [Lachnospiraceae bacterium]|nr:sensor histidine kinase KdpD [Lachnospiraceae bacterium]MDY3301767.1 sensor histidine kinase KdpD [Lachnospiraceae bacterium]